MTFVSVNGQNPKVQLTAIQRAIRSCGALYYGLHAGRF